MDACLIYFLVVSRGNLYFSQFIISIQVVSAIITCVILMFKETYA